jgi:hypothetical protein
MTIGRRLLVLLAVPLVALLAFDYVSTATIASLSPSSKRSGRRQMIGRGTRLRRDLFGPGKDKTSS